MDEVNAAAIAVAAACGERLVDACEPMAAALLGGGLTMWDRRMETISDIDMFTYLDLPELPSLEKLVSMARGIGLDPRDARQRLFLSEFRCTLDGFDTNIKFFTLAKLESSVVEPPNLSEIHLEEQQTYQTYRLLASRGDRVAELLERVAAELDTRTAAMADLALEAYGKLLSGAIKQGIYRGTEPRVAWLSGDMAVQYLLMVAYLQAGVYPAPFKWRASEALLKGIPGGPTLYAHLGELQDSSSSLGDFLAALHSAELCVAGQYEQAPWARFRDDRWWWTSYDPVGRRAADEPFPAR